MHWASRTSRLTVLAVGLSGWVACGGRSQHADPAPAVGGAEGRAGASTAAANSGHGGAGAAGAAALGGAGGTGGTTGAGGFRACSAPPDLSSPLSCCVTSCVAGAPNAEFTALTELGSFDFSYAWRGGVTGFTSQGWLDFSQSSPVATCGSPDLRALLSVVAFDNYAAPPLGQQTVQISLASATTTGTLDVTSISDSGTLDGTLDVPAWRVHVSFEAPLCGELYTVDK